MKLIKFLSVAFISLLLVGCIGTSGLVKPIKPIKHTHEVIIKVVAVDPTKVEVTKGEDEDKIRKSMEVPNPTGSLSTMSAIMGDEAIIKLYSALTVSDVSSLNNDIKYLYKMTNVRKIVMFINSPGGDAFSGLALADEVERAKKLGFEVTVQASGIVASAAVPVFAVGTKGKRFAAEGTIFMVHETSIWKWPGRETASDIRSQNRLMDLIRDRYITKLANSTNLSKEEWERLEKKTTWFSAQKAKKWGLVDEIE